ncbi:predicted protein [Plenodomus lingam JN3]|uniref:Predicted protein n=1 Tax=Leptosphaeria maculans (strain JN3 / isolate v23.1.3 / race Av1-4-5-6-7-8) TaxID=985895 RepID=E5AC60_LEPMJ|nr:predicted protein [Plenodomus lingam JN3]CBY00171.1 predicted protein [Plenodomus lingam JN3]
MDAYPKPRHNYIYTPRYGQRGILSYAGQQQNGAYPAGIMPGGFNAGVGLVAGVGVGLGYAAGVYQPAVYNARSYYPYAYSAGYYPATHYQYPSYGGYYNVGLYGQSYPLANFYTPYQRTYYNTTPTYGYTTAHVYPPGPHTTTTTTYHVTNAQAQPFQAAPQVVRETRPAFGHNGHPTQGFSREEIQMENRRVATLRGAYDPRKIRPADARDDDPFWCRELNGEWHLRSYYQIEMECQPGRWMMDADIGFLVFHRG